MLKIWLSLCHTVEMRFFTVVDHCYVYNQLCADVHSFNSLDDKVQP